MQIYFVSLKKMKSFVLERNSTCLINVRIDDLFKWILNCTLTIKLTRKDYLLEFDYLIFLNF